MPDVLEEASIIITFDNNYTVYPEDLVDFYDKFCNERMSAQEIADLYMGKNE